MGTKMVIIMSFVFALMGCSVNDSLDQDLDKASTEKKNGIEDNNHPIFDPKTIQIGDVIGSWELVNKEVVPATEDYPVDLVHAEFKGETALVGKLVHISENDEFFPNELAFYPNGDSLAKLPISHHDTRTVWFIFENKEAILDSLEIQPGETIDHLPVRISDYTIHFAPTEISNTAIFLGMD